MGELRKAIKRAEFSKKLRIIIKTILNSKNVKPNI